MTEESIDNPSNKGLCSRCGKNPIYRKMVKLCRKCYEDERKFKKHLESPIIPCADGCGEMIHSIGPKGDKVRYIKGHQKLINFFKADKKDIITTDGRVKIYVPLHPYSDFKGYVARARLVVEQYIGRFLEPWYIEQVHHINGDKMDDRFENLQIVSPTEHIIIHNTVDMSDRICNNPGCKYRDKEQRRWIDNEDGTFTCHNCYMNLKYKKLRKSKKQAAYGGAD